MSTNRWPLILALDGSVAEAKLWVSRLKNEIWGVKVGSVLFTHEGPQIVKYFKDEGVKVFLDLKFHDIPNTVKKSVEAAFHSGVDLLTVHASGGRAMLEAAAKLQSSAQTVCAVTVLTSLEASDLADLGCGRDMASQVESLGRLALQSGIRGLVCSPLEVASLREQSLDAVLVVPGVRLAGDTSHQDQKRVATFSEVFKAGATYAVLGRALTAASDWGKTWSEIQFSMDDIFSKKP